MLTMERSYSRTTDHHGQPDRLHYPRLYWKSHSGKSPVVQRASHMMARLLFPPASHQFEWQLEVPWQRKAELSLSPRCEHSALLLGCWCQYWRTGRCGPSGHSPNLLGAHLYGQYQRSPQLVISAYARSIVCLRKGQHLPFPFTF